MKIIILKFLALTLLFPSLVLADEKELDDTFTPMIENMMAENNIQGFSFSALSLSDL